METLNYTIERADNGYIIGDTDACSLNVSEDKASKIEYLLGKKLMDCIKYLMDAECTNKVRMKIEYEPITERNYEENNV